MITALTHGNRVDSLEFLSAPKRKRDEGGADPVTAARAQHQEDDDDDDVVYFPQHKRSNSVTGTLFSFSLASNDSERRDGPASSDDEADALVKTFRSSVFRGPSPVSYASPAKGRDEEEEDDDGFFAIGRATTICDDSDSSGEDGSSFDPPDMLSDSPPPQDELLEGERTSGQDRERDWSSTPLFLECSRGDEAKESESPSRRGRLVSPASASLTGPSRPSPLWTTTANKDSFWPASWTGTFHLGSS